MTARSRNLLLSRVLQSGSHVEVKLALSLPFVWLPLLVELDVVVATTRNTRGTIVSAGKQNEGGY